MSAKTTIEWCTRTWNPVRGCSRVSPGCGGAGKVGGCYAERVARRFDFPGGAYEGLTRGTENGPRWSGVVRLIPEALDEPLRWRKPQRIFVNSMSDLFHEGLPDEAIDRVFAVMMAAHWHTFQVLTKRPERMLSYLSRTTGDGNALARVMVQAKTLPFPRGYVHADGFGWPYRNIHLGVSVEDQQRADERIPLLLQTPAVVRWVSYEPALGPVDFTRIPMDGGAPAESDRYLGTARGLYLNPLRDTPGSHDALDWIVVGGESGPGARPFDLEWARAVLRQCAGTPTRVFIKQLGARPSVACVCGWPDSCRCTVSLKNKKGGDPDEWPADLRVREMPGGAR